jgi:hypothetical protein
MKRHKNKRKRKILRVRSEQIRLAHFLPATVVESKKRYKRQRDKTIKDSDIE